jgi:hypothetical protein
MLAFCRIDIDQYPFSTTDIIVIQQWRFSAFSIAVMCPVFSFCRCAAQDRNTTIAHHSAYIGKIHIDLAGAVDYIGNTFCSSCQTLSAFAKASFIFKLPNWWRNLSLLITSKVSTWFFSSMMPSSACAILFLPS